MDGETHSVEVAVVGGGPAGLTAAVALAAAGVETALIAKAPPADNRTTALWSASVAAMEALDVWPLCRESEFTEDPLSACARRLRQRSPGWVSSHTAAGRRAGAAGRQSDQPKMIE